ncbi:hypothetical protein, partial [Escherichia coli]|uniref:hypothetical protein n=1 Tax=Escherichia coli TaxID=562 RepID=UPI0019548256
CVSRDLLVLSYFPAVWPPRSGGEARLGHAVDGLHRLLEGGGTRRVHGIAVPDPGRVAPRAESGRLRVPDR